MSEPIGRTGRGAQVRSRRPLLTAALGFARVRADTPELRPLHAWLDSWRGIGAIAVGMARQGYDLQLTEYAGQNWRANFYPAPIAHSVVVASAWESTPWRAVQRAAWETLRAMDRQEAA